jgi:hypothetical protein
MNAAPKWFVPVAILAMLWNLMGCIALAGDLMLSAEDIARLPPEQQAMYAARPGWAVLATGAAVIGGLLGSLGLALRKRWARPLLVLSLVGLIAQDIGMFGLTDAVRSAGPAPLLLQGLVLAIAIGLVLLARRAVHRGWIV